MDDLAIKLIPFLDKYKDLLHAKRKTYELFREITLQLYKKKHQDLNILKELVKKPMNYQICSPNPVGEEALKRFTRS